MKRRICSLVVMAVCLSVFGSCGSFGIITKAMVTPKSNNTKVYYSKNGIKYDLVGTGPTLVRLNNYRRTAYFKQELEGFHSDVTTVKRSKLNWLFLLDFALPLASSVGLGIVNPGQDLSRNLSGSNAPSTVDYTLAVPLFIGATAGWLYPHIWPKRKYAKTIELPELAPVSTNVLSELVIKDSLDNYTGPLGLFRLGKTERELEKDALNLFKYATAADFKYKRYAKVHEEARKDISNDRFKNFDNILKRELYARALMDTLDKRSIKIELNYRLQKADYIKYDGKVQCELTVKWWTKSDYSEEHDVTRISTVTSDWRAHGDGDDYADDPIQYVTDDAWMRVMAKILAEEHVRKSLQSLGKMPKEITAQGTKIAINPGTKFASTVGESVASVVTIELTEGHGSGCIVSDEGHIITNFHVIESDTANLKAILSDGTKRKAKVLRINPALDLALVKIDSVMTIPLKLSRNESILVGAEVFAIGTPRDIELGQTVTKGIISGKRVKNENTFIQTDVPINSGNSGGALINAQGDLLGIVSAKLKGIGIEGIGFAIPSHLVEELLNLEMVY
jgi:hypothetical protein